MIRNERQYRIISSQRKHLADALDELVGSTLTTVEDGTDIDQAAWKSRIARDSLASEIASLDEELQEYELLQRGVMHSLTVSSVRDLPDALVRARIASGLTQRDLAERLGLKEQQIQKYEANNYATASLRRIQEVMDALDVRLAGGIDLPRTATPLSQLKTRLRQLGFDRQMIDRRLMRDSNGITGAAGVAQIIQRLSRLLDVPMAVLTSDSEPAPALATAGWFKTSRSAAQPALEAYSRYAEGLAKIVVRATEGLQILPRPGTAREIREGIETALDEFDVDDAEPAMSSALLLKATLRYVNGLGIPVIALRDPGAFHGACFFHDGRPVIVLKQTTDSPARWLADLLHELDHIRSETGSGLRTWIELGEISAWNEAPEEQHANDFAADILFSGRAEPVVNQCLRAANGSVQRLKSVVRDVAMQAEVPPDILANYLAYRLGEQRINWWGTASTFQESASSWRIVTDELIPLLDIGSLDAVDREILIDALAS
ncbi:helix-turn-helix domain-containing protein [Kribbella sindirgiensis]|uniref:XRE family transcriptional regulator n=1 Tax=Kribbella sindirgiensis TaxID=1124744 RepID=A0A4R0IZ38_9ACTN|nr:helix-turn-helix transcriptional regulator [Kribbella sindirgiensis]TCC39361.1 XRE family transcriptional regulator [Kribbella sindirgiensis]